MLCDGPGRGGTHVFSVENMVRKQLHLVQNRVKPNIVKLYLLDNYNLDIGHLALFKQLFFKMMPTY